MTRPELRRQAASRRPTSEDNDVFFLAHFVKSVEELPYNNSVIHINAVLASAVNLIRFMSAHGCKVFAGDEGGAAADVGVQGGTSGIIMPESFEQSPLQSPPTPLKRRANALSRWSFHVARISLCDSFPFSCWNEFPSDLYLPVLLISLVWSLGNTKSISTSSGSSGATFFFPTQTRFHLWHS